MAILLYSLIISIIIIGGGLVLFKKIKILDTPWKYKDLKRKKPVPKLIGVFLILASILSIILLIPGYWKIPETKALFIGGLFLGIIALIDEIKGIHPLFRLLIQILVSIIGILGGALITHINFFGHIIELPYLIGFILSLIWFILIINSLNWFDGINGMGAGISSIGFLTIALLIKLVIFKNYNISVAEYKHFIFLLNISIIMISVSFIATLIELKPHGLIRDIGIMFLGYVLAYLSLFIGGKIGILLVVLSLPIFDAFWVIINRIKNKKNPLKGDYRHFHHRLIAIGWTRGEIRSFVRIWTIFFMVIMILQGVNNINKIIIFLMIFIIFFGLHIYIYWIKKLPNGLGERK